MAAGGAPPQAAVGTGRATGAAVRLVLRELRLPIAMRDARQLVECRNPDCRAFGMLCSHTLQPAKHAQAVVAVCTLCGRENPRPASTQRPT